VLDLMNIAGAKSMFVPAEYLEVVVVRR